MAHDSQTVELAYQVWAFEAGRSAPRTVEILARDHEIDIPLRTLQHWAAGSYQGQTWAERVERDLASIAPAIRRETISEIVLGSLEAARGLRRVVRGDEPADKSRITAYLGMLDRGGFGHIGHAPDRTVHNPVSELTGVNVDTLSVDELIALDERIRSERTPVQR